MNSKRFCINNSTGKFTQVYNPVLTIQLIRKVKINAFHSSFELILTPIWHNRNNCYEKFDCGDYCIDKSNVCDGVVNCPKDEIFCDAGIN